jgi:hypothetical protein
MSASGLSCIQAGYICNPLNLLAIQLMNGIPEAFTVRIGKGAEVRTARDGKPWAPFPVARIQLNSLVSC